MNVTTKHTLARIDDHINDIHMNAMALGAAADILLHNAFKLKTKLKNARIQKSRTKNSRRTIPDGS